MIKQSVVKIARKQEMRRTDREYLSLDGRERIVNTGFKEQVKLDGGIFTE